MQCVFLFSSSLERRVYIIYFIFFNNTLINALGTNVTNFTPAACSLFKRYKIKAWRSLKHEMDLMPPVRALLKTLSLSLRPNNIESLNWKLRWTTTTGSGWLRSRARPLETKNMLLKLASVCAVPKATKYFHSNKTAAHSHYATPITLIYRITNGLMVDDLLDKFARESNTAAHQSSSLCRTELCVFNFG